jgi:hypothetical protein
MSTLRERDSYQEVSNPGTKKFEGKVTCTTNGNVASYTGKGVTVTKTGTGVYAFTLDKPYRKLVTAAFWMASDTLLNPQQTPAGDAVATTGILTVAVKNSSSANTNATSGDTMYYEIVVDKLGRV